MAAWLALHPSGLRSSFQNRLMTKHGLPQIQSYGMLVRRDAPSRLKSGVCCTSPLRFMKREVQMQAKARGPLSQRSQAGPCGSHYLPSRPQERTCRHHTWWRLTVMARMKPSTGWGCSPPQDFAFLEDFDLPELLRATASRMSALKADSSTSSVSWISIARRTFPSRLELNS